MNREVKEVEIYGKKYWLRGDDVGNIAKYVDEKMREFFGEPPKPLREEDVILVALNIVEEFFNYQREVEQRQREFMARIDDLVGRIDEKLS